jgi:DNA-binding Lrp family transcriptional regulator
MANISSDNDMGYGQVSTSINDLSGKTGLPRSTIWNCLKKLEASGCISQKVEGIKSRVITIFNYDDYHGINKVADNPQPNNFIDAMRKAQIWRESVMMKFRISKDEFNQLLDGFSLDCACNDKHHTSESEARRHFINWVNKKKEINKNSELKNAESIKNIRRRASEVTASSPADFKGSF